jgi:3-deoxy-D-manno-octulosonic-acid transferase
LEQLGHVVARRTQPADGVNPAKPDILLVDTTGELASWYLCASVVFIGTSLCAKGGQNPAEPVTEGVPVVFGPNMQNFATLVKSFLDAEAAIEIQDAATLQQAVRRLLESPELRTSMADKAAKCLAVHRGATTRTVKILCLL